MFRTWVRHLPLAALLAGPAAIAAEAVPPQGPPLLVAADADHDGKVTAAELRSERERQVARFDADQDGSLSPQEYAAWFLDAAQPRLARRFKADDRDGNGRIALEELVERSAAMLHRRDRDGDGALSADELRPRRRPTQVGVVPADDVSGPSVRAAGSS